MRKKKKNQDFQKVKLKVGRKLPRDSSTNTSFKTHSIQIKEQLVAASNNEPTTKRKLKIEDLLTQLQHYNTGSRHSAVTGLRELSTAHPTMVTQHLAAILEKITPLFMDKDSAVRQAVIKLLKVVLSNPDTEELMPFFGILSSHLSCAMTHIIEDIRIDALSVLDICLELHPKLVITGSSRLLPNFISQISQCQSQGSKTGSFSLTVNPSGKMGAQKWRLRVLERLNRFLTAYLENLPKRTESEEKCNSCEARWREDTEICYQQGSDTNIANGGFTFRTMLSSHEPVNTGADYLYNFIATVIPLLFQCWVEVLPTEGSGNSVSVDCHPTMVCILQILLHLSHCVLIMGDQDDTISLTWLHKLCHADIRQHMQPYFPFILRGTAKRQHKDHKVNIKSAALDLNLCFCEIICTFLKGQVDTDKGDISSKNEFLLAVVGFMTQSFPSTHNLQQRKKAVSVMTSLIECCRNLDVQNDLLSAVQRAYKTSHTLSSERRLLVELFSHVLFKLDVNNNPVIIDWLRGVPDEWKMVWSHSEVNNTLPLLHVLSMAVKTQRNDQQFLDSLQAALLDLMSNHTLLSSLSSPQQGAVSDLFYHLPMISREQYMSIGEWCRNVGGRTEDKKYLIHVLMCRFLKVQIEGPSVTDMSSFISLLLSVLLGTSMSSLADLQNEMVTSGQVFRIYKVVDGKIADQHMVQIVCGMFRQFPENCQIQTLISSCLLDILSKYNTFPVQTAISLLQCFYTVSKLPGPEWSVPRSLMSSIVQLLGSVWEWSVGNKGVDSSVGMDAVGQILTMSVEARTLFLEEILHTLTVSDIGYSSMVIAAEMLSRLLRVDEVYRSFHDCSLIVREIKDVIETAVSREGNKKQLVVDFLYTVSSW